MLKGITTKLFAIAFAISLLSFLPIVAAADGGHGGPESGGNGNAFGHDQQWKDRSGSEGATGNGHHNDASIEEGYRKHFFGHFNLTDGVAEGKFIAFAFDEDSGNVSDYALRNGSGEVTFFDSIHILGFQPSNISLHGSVMLFGNATVQAIIHDNPTGMFHVVSNETNTTVSFLLASGMSAFVLSPPVDDDDDAATSVMDEDVIPEAVAVVGHGAYGMIVTDAGNITVEDTEDGTYVNVTVSYDHLIFRAKPLFSHHSMNQNAILQAISEGRVAGEMSVVLRDGVVSYDTMEYRDQFRMHLMSAERDRIRLQVEDQEHQGKVVVINVDQGTMDIGKGEFRLELDGKAVRATTNPLEVLYAEGSSPSDAVYCVIESEGANQFMVYVPSFSMHELTLASLGPMDALLSVMGIVAIVGALAVVAVAGVLMLRRKR